jgi:hypothetical protein
MRKVDELYQLAADEAWKTYDLRGLYFTSGENI